MHANSRPAQAARKREIALARYNASPKLCECCGLPILVRDNERVWNARHRRFCSRRCVVKSVSKEERRRRGLLHSEKARKTRYLQLEHEEEMANELRSDGWEIFSPTVVCDRIGVKNGKVFFIEFKPAKKPQLRPGRKESASLFLKCTKLW